MNSYSCMVMLINIVPSQEENRNWQDLQKVKIKIKFAIRLISNVVNLTKTGHRIILIT